MTILETRDLYFTYPDGENRKVILNEVNVSFEKGKFYTILGASGSGKTTFLSLIAALDKPEKGEILFNGEDISKIGLEKYRRNNIGIVFQSYNLIPYMNGLENVMVAMSITDNKIEGNMKDKALEILESVGIDGTKATRRINRLSGGEQQRVAIARAISTNVEVIVADGAVSLKQGGSLRTGTITQGKTELEVFNNPGVELPSTGGPGTRMIYLLGGMLTMAGLLLMHWRKRIET